MSPKVTIEEIRSALSEYRPILLLAALALSTGTIVMHFVEKLTWVDSFYFSTVSLTTVGYGDITPHTSAGKIFVSIYLITSLFIVATLLEHVVRSALVTRVAKKTRTPHKRATSPK